MEKALAAAMTNLTLRTRAPRRKGCGAVAEGEMVLRREEMLLDVTLSANTSDSNGSVVLALTNFPWLRTVAGSFERYKWKRLNIHWRAAGGFNKGGLIAIGMDWSSQMSSAYTKPNLNANSERQKVLSLTPHMSLPISATSINKMLGLPTRMLNSRNWYDATKTDDEGAVGTLRYAAKCDADTVARFIGEIWVDYEVILQGTRA